jgi:hypothetical protein
VIEWVSDCCADRGLAAGEGSVPAREDGTMSELFATYVVAFSAMLLAAVAAKVLFTTVDHFDPPETAASSKPALGQRDAARPSAPHQAA